MQTIERTSLPFYDQPNEERFWPQGIKAWTYEAKRERAYLRGTGGRLRFPTGRWRPSAANGSHSLISQRREQLSLSEPQKERRVKRRGQVEEEGLSLIHI